MKMEKETFFTGYCRQLDQSRMVTAVTEDSQLIEVDCCYGSCVYEPNCTVAENIRSLLKVKKSCLD